MHPIGDMRKCVMCDVYDVCCVILCCMCVCLCDLRRGPKWNAARVEALLSRKRNSITYTDAWSGRGQPFECSKDMHGVMEVQGDGDDYMDDEGEEEEEEEEDEEGVRNKPLCVFCPTCVRLRVVCRYCVISHVYV